MSLRTQADRGPMVTASQVTSFLLVTCGDTHLALPAGVIRGIVKPDDGGMADVLAILEVQTPVTDLAQRFGLLSAHSSDARIVVCGMGSVRRAFLVSGIVGLEDVESLKVSPLLPHFTGPERQWFSGMFLFRETVALVVEPDWLLRNDRGHGGEMSNASVPGRGQEMSVAIVPLDMAVRHTTVDTGQFDVLELEEATDADDIPWAQL